MPSAQDLLKKMEKKKFKKVEYRPWDYDLQNRNDDVEEVSESKLAPSADENKQKAKNADAKKNVKQKKSSLSNLSSEEKDSLLKNKIIAEDNEVRASVIVTSKSHEAKVDTLEINKLFDDRDEYLQIARSIKALVGPQRNVFFLFFNACHKSNKLNTIAYSVKDIQGQLGISTVGTVNLAIERLVKKGLIKRLESKKGRGGYLNLGFDQTIWDVCLSLKEELEELSTI